jgi:hypothetical protein
LESLAAVLKTTSSGSQENIKVLDEIDACGSVWRAFFPALVSKQTVEFSPPTLSPSPFDHIEAFQRLQKLLIPPHSVGLLALPLQAAFNANAEGLLLVAQFLKSLVEHLGHHHSVSFLIQLIVIFKLILLQSSWPDDHRLVKFLARNFTALLSVGELSSLALLCHHRQIRVCSCLEDF